MVLLRGVVAGIDGYAQKGVRAQWCVRWPIGVLAGWGLITLFWTAMYHFLGAGDSIVIKLVDIGFALGLALLIMARFGIQSKQHTESRWGSKLSNWLWNIWPFAYIGGLLFLLIRWIVNWLN